MFAAALATGVCALWLPGDHAAQPGREDHPAAEDESFALAASEA
jgi:hypothetical protein